MTDQVQAKIFHEGALTENLDALKKWFIGQEIKQD